MTTATRTDRYGNQLAAGLPYARGKIVRSTEDDLAKLRTAWRYVRARTQGEGQLFNFSGLVRSLPWRDADMPYFDDELAPALYGERLREVALEHLGGDPARHDILLLNRLTGGLFASHLALVEQAGTVIGVSARYSHPVLPRSARRVGAEFVDTAGADAFVAALERADDAVLVALTRLSVTYELLPEEECTAVIDAAHQRGLPVLIDDAGGARVGPALHGQPRMLEFGPEVGATGLDKYGTLGPRLGLLGGEAELVARIRARAFELGLEARPMLYPAALHSLEAYDPDVVRARAEATALFATELRARVGDHVLETPGTAQLPGEAVLAIALDRAGLPAELPGVVPYEATAALAMLLLRDHGVLTVHFAGLPPGNGGLLLKFLPLETLDSFGGPAALATAIDESLDRLALSITRPEELSAMFYEESKPVAGRVQA